MESHRSATAEASQAQAGGALRAAIVPGYRGEEWRESETLRCLWKGFNQQTKKGDPLPGEIGHARIRSICESPLSVFAGVSVAGRPLKITTTPPLPHTPPKKKKKFRPHHRSVRQP